jgi:hypothetical protein
MMILMVLAGAVSMAVAEPSTTIIDTGFTTPDWANGDATQNSWFEVPNTGTNAFNIIDAGGSGFLDTATASFNDVVGNYIYAAGAGNAVDDEYAGVMDFTLSRTTNAYAAGDIFRMGISDTVQTNLSNGFTNQVYMRIGSTTAGELEVKAPTLGGGAVILLTVQPEVLGWDDVTDDRVTDQWRLSWSMRKTRASLDGGGYYSFTCAMENLDNPTNLYGVGYSVEKPVIYAESNPFIMMGHCEFASYNTSDRFDITVDDLRYVKTAGVLPTLYPTTVSANAGNTVVDLSWPHVAEAQSYDVKQILGAVTNTVIAGITTNGYQDTGLVNGLEYIYIVTSHATAAADADSIPVSAFPDAAITGTILDTSFAATDSPDFTDGDLAGQNGWKTAFPGLEAFNVDSAGSGFAETATFQGSFDSSDGNAVYYNKFSSNTVKAAWSGTTVFSLSVNPEPGLFATNFYDIISGGVTNAGTNIQQVANLQGRRIFGFGITGNPAANFESNNGHDALVTVRSQGSGNLEIGFNQNGADDPEMLINNSVLGWDPENQDAVSNEAPGFVTEPITINWKIRKLAATNAYVLVYDAAVGTNTYTTSPIYLPNSVQGADSEPSEVWPADVAYFGMVHENQALGGEGQVEVVNVSVDSVSVTHTNDGFDAIAPFDLAYKNGNLAINLSWTDILDATSYEVWRQDGTSETSDPFTRIASNLTSAAYTDPGLIDKRTYFYKVAANYPGAIDAMSETLIARALGQINVEPLHFGESTSIITGSTDLPFTRSTEALVPGGDVKFSEGTGVDGAIVAAGVGIYNETMSLYGVFQCSTNVNLPTSQCNIDHRAADDSIRIGKDGDNPGNLYTAVIYMKPSAPLNFMATNFNIKIVVATGGNTMRAAIRNNGNWYVSQQDFSGTGDGDDDLSRLGLASWGEIDIATSSKTNFMEVPTNYVVRTDLNNVDAIGYFVWDDTNNTRVKEILLSFGTSLLSYEEWTDSVALYNENAPKTEDPDHDGYNNVWEWGQGGDPLDPDSVGYTNRYMDQQTDGGTNFFVYIYPRLKTPRPDYYLSETDNLVFGDFSNAQSNYVVNTLGNWLGDTAFQTVTNLIPTTNAVKFIQLNIE